MSKSWRYTPLCFDILNLRVGKINSEGARWESRPFLLGRARRFL
jgi:hypothetical protein